MLLYSHFHGRGKLFPMKLYTSSWQLHFSWIWWLKLRLSLKQLELVPWRALGMTKNTFKLSWRDKWRRTRNTSGPCCHADHLLFSDPKELCITGFVFQACDKTQFLKSKVLIETHIAEGRSGSCFSCGVWLPTAPNLTSVKVRIKKALELWKNKL